MLVHTSRHTLGLRLMSWSELSPGAKRSIKQSERGALAGALAAAAGWIYYHKAAVTQPFISIITTAPHTAPAQLRDTARIQVRIMHGMPGPTALR